MANIFISRNQHPKFGNQPFGNLSFLSFALKTSASGAALNADNSTAPLAINDKVYLGTLPAGFVKYETTTVVALGLTALVTGDLGIEYVDGVDSPVLPQASNMFGSNLAMAAVARLADATVREPIALPKEAHLVLTIKGANNVKVGNVNFLIVGEQR